MLLVLRTLFVVVFVSMVAVTSWASLQQSLLAIPREVLRNPWFIATLVDAYWAFLTFFVWVAWKEQRHLARALWFVAIVLLGNLAMAAYMLRELFGIRAAAQLGDVFGRRNPGHVPLPALLVGAAVAVYALA